MRLNEHQVGPERCGETVPITQSPFHALSGQLTISFCLHSLPASLLPWPHSQEPCSLFHWENSHNQKGNPRGSPRPRVHLPGLALLCGPLFPCGWTLRFLSQRPLPCVWDAGSTSPAPQARSSLQHLTLVWPTWLSPVSTGVFPPVTQTHRYCFSPTSWNCAPHTPRASFPLQRARNLFIPLRGRRLHKSCVHWLRPVFLRSVESIPLGYHRSTPQTSFYHVTKALHVVQSVTWKMILIPFYPAAVLRTTAYSVSWRNFSSWFFRHIPPAELGSSFEPPLAGPFCSLRSNVRVPRVQSADLSPSFLPLMPELCHQAHTGRVFFIIPLS